jgi:MFS family permease
VIGLILSLFFVRETLAHVELEARGQASSSTVTLGHVFYVTTIGNASLFAACQAGLVNNLNDGMSWGIYPLYFASFGLGVEAIGVIKAVYPGVWGVLQIVTGPISDRRGRKALIAGGMIVQTTGIWLTVTVPAYPAWITGAVLQGVGTAMVYPTLLAAITDHTHPTSRATSLGVYRFWRDSGYAIGALLSGIVADLVGLDAAIHLVAGLTLLSGLVVVYAMAEARSYPVTVAR